MMPIPKRTCLSTALACILVCGCAATPAPPLVADGSDHSRVQANEKLVYLNAMTVQKQEYERERAGMMQKIRELGEEISNLKEKKPAAPKEAPRRAEISRPAAPASRPPLPRAGSPAALAAAAAGVDLARVHTGKDAARPGAADSKNSKEGKEGKEGRELGASTGHDKQPVAAPGAAGPGNRETIVIQETGMIFRVMHNYARTDFHPSKALQAQLLQAARAGKRIEIRGRTDATTNNEKDREIAMRRALNARVYLANNGIHPRKMHIDYKAAGDHVADNSTTQGRARNRRVEIETIGISQDVLEDMASVIRQDLQ